MKHKLYNRFLSVALALALVVGMLPGMTFAGAVDTTAPQSQAEQVEQTEEVSEPTPAPSAEPAAQNAANAAPQAEARAYTESFTVQYRTTSGGTISGYDNFTYSISYNDSTVQVQNIAQAPRGYTFKYARIGNTNTTVTAVRVKENDLWPWDDATYTLQYGTYWYGRTEWHNWDGNRTLTLYYEKVSKPELVNTIDTSDVIEMDLFNYDAPAINNNHTFQFNGNIGGNNDINNWSGYVPSYRGDFEAVYQDIVAQKGISQINTYGNTQYYPQLNYQIAQSNQSLQYLFDSSIVSGKTSYQTNYLFRMVNGYYTYDSAQHFAEYDENDQRFYVYNAKSTDGQHAMFMPFNIIDEDGNIQGDKDYFFGMHLGFDMVQPSEGEVTNPTTNKPEDMVFKFNGDDDFWVFIDGVLILDLGGIHGAAEGSINFATGEVKVPKRTNEYGNTIWESGTAAGIYRDSTNYWNTDKYVWSQETTIRELVQEAGVSADFDGDTFSDWSTHRVDIYYLERGQGGSNCKFEFNIQTIPSGTITVGKEITQAVQEGFADAKFTMQVDISDSEDGTYTPYKGSYTVYDANGSKDYVGNTKNGQFVLQNGQYAVLDNKDTIKANTYYKVTELDVFGYESDYIFDLSATGMVDQDGATVAGQVGQSYPIMVGDTPLVYVENQFKYNGNEEKYMFAIQKELDNGTNEDTYKVQITNGNGVPYTGNYRIRDIGEGLPSESQKAPDTGIISLKAGQEIVILDVLPGTTYVVNEVELDSDKYASPNYASSGNCKEVDVDVEGYAVQIERNEVASSTATVTITNSLKTGSLKITKTVEGLDDDTDALNELKQSLTFTIIGDNIENKTIRFNAEGWKQEGNTYTYTLNGVPLGSYTVTESNYDVTGYNRQEGQATTATGEVKAAPETSTPAALTNTYTPANVTLTIKKNLTDFANNGKPVFSFKITDYTDGTVYYLHIDMTGKDTGKDVLVGTIEIPAGHEYMVEELTNLNYECTDSQSTPQMTITRAAIGKEEGTINEDTTVTFTNDPNNTDIPTDGSATENRVESAAGGVIVWKKDPVEYGKDEGHDNITPKPTPEPSVE